MLTTPSRIAIGLGLTLLLAISPSLPRATATHLDGETKNEFTIYHVVGAPADEVSVPPALKALKKSLVSKTNRKSFKMLGSAIEVTLEIGKPKVVAIPGKLGKIELTVDGEGKVEVVMFGADDKRQGAIASRVFPVIWLNDKIKTEGGDYILVFDRKKTD